MVGGIRRVEEDRLKTVLLAAFGEKGLNDSGAVGDEDTRNDFDLMVEARVGQDLEAGADGAAFGIIGAVNEAWDACLDDCASAHAAGLDRDVENGSSEAVIAEEAGGLAEDDDFRVGGGVIVADGAIAGTGEDFAAVDEDGPDGDIASGSRGASFLKRCLHELDISFHVHRENSMVQERVRKQGYKHEG